MMKKLIIISGVFAVLVTSAGCKKFLDKEPDNRAKLNSPEKVSQLLASAYPQNNYYPMAEVSSDNVGDCITDENGVPSWSTLLNNLYFYEDNKGVDEDGPESYWFGCYKAIAAANLALETIAKVPDPQNYQAQKGEALVARAYAHFMLVNFFAKFYNESTADTDPGIPYVTEPENVSIKKYDRKTVKYVYDMIQKDLFAGIPLIVNEAYAKPKYHFTKTAANAFAARYYLYKQEYDSVIKYATASIAENSFAANLRPWNNTTVGVGYTTLDLNGNNSLSVVYTQPDQKANLLLVETNSWWWRLSSFGRFSLTTDIASSLTSNVPVSGGPWSFSTGSYVQGHPVLSKVEEYFVETSIGSGIGNGWEMVPLFSTEEVLFNLAEAYTYKGETAKAISLLNTYLSTRIDGYVAGYNIDEASIKGYYGVTDIQEGLIYTILDYKQSEFLQEGMRWFDIIRYGIEVTHEELDATGQHVVRTKTLTADDPHKVFQIPVTAQIQAGLAPNPRP
ncbi:RagB/SusD family nutrient uptake outer membrane protein [Ferruginibacter lapsinanis]|uniref:RagB/SusD family nutrient uptake outer membrane protein n=1 Tax=Ferruginibacter lapsinanis TaxID=563172 RepID=UPI001E350F08|nr:RagB/SusD family nutrient uptake outer membrane protein [Ferruginibacter lapsinanis]UEG48505.1 RagB/SusD family nutrient uptake outer membrane protein [Ferruginibacter lapsinanis]